MTVSAGQVSKLYESEYMGLERNHRNPQAQLPSLTIINEGVRVSLQLVSPLLLRVCGGHGITQPVKYTEVTLPLQSPSVEVSPQLNFLRISLINFNEKIADDAAS